MLRATGEAIAVDLARGNFGAFGRRFAVPLPLAGLVITFYLGPLKAVSDPSALARAPLDSRPLRVLLRELRALRIVGSLVWIVQFAAMPLLAWHRPLLTALTICLPLIYALNIVQAGIVIWQRERLGVSSPWSLIAEILLCPPYGANLAGRLAVRWRGSGDPASLAYELDPVGAARCLAAENHDVD